MPAVIRESATAPIGGGAAPVLSSPSIDALTTGMRVALGIHYEVALVMHGDGNIDLMACRNGQVVH